MVVAFVPPVGDRLVEYANHAPHARFVARELVPRPDRGAAAGRQPGRADPDGVQLRGVAAVSTAARYPDGVRLAAAASRRRWSSPTSAQDHGGGPVFDPVVKFVNALPRPAAADRGPDLP